MPRYLNPLQSALGETFFSRLPRDCGVYCMYDREGGLLYIGKAKNLRTRLFSYRNAKPGAVPEKVIEMLDHVREIRWQVCETEAEALARESELLHAIQPPYNISQAWDARYPFIGIRFERAGSGGRSWMHWRLADDDEKEDYELFGCFRHRPLIKRGYTALLRVVFAAGFTRERFQYPARITRRSPAWEFSLEFPAIWVRALREFLSGESESFARLMVRAALANERIPRYVYPSLQKDFRAVGEFFRIGPRATRELVARHRLAGRLVRQAMMDQWIEKDFERTIGRPPAPIDQGYGPR